MGFFKEMMRNQSVVTKNTYLWRNCLQQNLVTMSNCVPSKEFMRNASDEYLLKLLRSDLEKNKKAFDLYHCIYVCPPPEYVYNISMRGRKRARMGRTTILAATTRGEGYAFCYRLKPDKFLYPKTFVAFPNSLVDAFRLCGVLIGFLS